MEPARVHSRILVAESRKNGDWLAFPTDGWKRYQPQSIGNACLSPIFPAILPQDVRLLEFANAPAAFQKCLFSLEIRCQEFYYPVCCIGIRGT